MSRWFLLALLLLLFAGCAGTEAVHCADGRTCPGGTVCDDVHTFCVDPLQKDACAGIADGEPCTAGTLMGHCVDEVCLASVCGDKVQEFGEMCDDGNTLDDETCSADCFSTIKCGNGVLDSQLNEECDDLNLLEHDGCSSQCKVETPVWIEHTMSPGVLGAAAFAYDSRRDRMVVFGGSDGVTIFGLNETLEWTGADWVLPHPTFFPPLRYDAAMAYDAERGVSVMFGGWDGINPLSDTWMWDGSSWVASSAGGPSRRLGHVMVYDSVRKVVVLFGGSDAQAGGDLQDTWEWDGSAWKENTSTPKPPPRRYAAASFDPKLGKVILVGGRNGTGPAYADTWTYDGTWKNVTPAGAHPAVRGARMAYDTFARKTMLSGGFIDGSVPQQTVWLFDGSTWATQIIGSAHTARAFHAMANTGTGVIVFGGGNNATTFGDTWRYDGTKWSSLVDMPARSFASSANDFVRRRAVIVGGQQASTLYGDTWQLTASGLEKLTSSPPSPRVYPAMAWDSARRNMLMFGGSNYPSYYNDAYRGSGMPWQWLALGSTGPTGRARPALAFDGARMVMFGGEVGDTVFDAQTWTLTDTTWNLETTPSAMVARGGAAIGYDPIRKHVVLFGGAIPSAALDDTWVWNGTSWHEVINSFRPSPRSGASLVWNPARQRLLLIGSSTIDSDAFEWDGDNEKWIPFAARNALPGRIAGNTFTSLDGSGIQLWGGYNGPYGDDYSAERWELRWEAANAHERCDQLDADRDGLVGCADPDCWPICAPTCAPGTTCDMAAPRCGDGTCSSERESCRTCPEDCKACTPVCGDYVCDSMETGCPGDCTP
jgi:cysteine-rich repeat protein